MATGDFDGDGIRDVLTRGQSLGQPGVPVTLSRGVGDGTFAAPVVVMASGYKVYGIAAIDVDNDGNQDAIVVDDDGVELLRGHGDGTFDPPRSLASSVGYFVAHDVDGDGLLDLVSGSSVYLNAGDGAFHGPSSASLAGVPVFGDLDGDGHLDIVINPGLGAGSSPVLVQLGRGDGTFGPASSFDGILWDAEPRRRRRGRLARYRRARVRQHAGQRASRALQLARQTRVVTTGVAHRSPAETPLMRQYLDVKDRHPDAIVFFRLGDFYEMFFEDAVRRRAAARSDADHARQGQGRRGADVRRPAPRRARLHREADRARPQGRAVRADRGSQARQGAGQARGRPHHHAGRRARRRRARAQAAALRRRARAERRRAKLCGPRVPRRDHRRAVRDRAADRARCSTSWSASRRARCWSRRQICATPVPLAPIARALPRAVEPAPNPATSRRATRARLAASSSRRGDRAAARVARGRARSSRTRGRPSRPARCRSRGCELYRPSDAVVLDEAAIANLELTETLIGTRKQGSLLDVIDETATAPGGRLLRRWLLYPLRRRRADPPPPGRGRVARRAAGAADRAIRARAVADRRSRAARRQGHARRRDAARSRPAARRAAPAARADRARARSGADAARRRCPQLLDLDGRARHPALAALAARLAALAGRRAAVAAQGRRRDPRRLRRDRRRVPPARRRRQGRDPRDRGARAEGQRHREPQGPLQPRVRLLHRDHQDAPREGARRTTSASRRSRPASATSRPSSPSSSARC